MRIRYLCMGGLHRVSEPSSESLSGQCCTCSHVRGEPDDNEGVRVHHLTPADRGVLERSARRATQAAAHMLQRNLRAPVVVGGIRIATAPVVETRAQWAQLPQRMGVMCVEVTGQMRGQLLLVYPASHGALLEPVGVQLLTTFIESLEQSTHLVAQASAPMVASDTRCGALDLPLLRAAFFGDHITTVAGSFAVNGRVGAASLRTPVHLLFVPTPDTLAAMLDVLDDNRPQHELAIPVHMGEMAVSRRAGDVLVVDDAGACVAVAMTDRSAGVGALAHIMLPHAPELELHASKPSSAARYANTAIPSLVAALERAGGRRDRTHAFIAGGGDLFVGEHPRYRDSPRQTLDAVRAALASVSIPVEAYETGRTLCMSLAVHIDDLRVMVTTSDTTQERLDAA